MAYMDVAEMPMDESVMLAGLGGENVCPPDEALRQLSSGQQIQMWEI